jgi:hypothetical protein
MYDIDYDIIIDRISNKYHIDILDIHRKLLVSLYNMAVSSNYPDVKTFEHFCDVTLLNSYLERKYPTLNLYGRAYSPWALN